MRVHEIRARMEAELAELEQMVAAAPEDHPAKAALRTIRERMTEGLHAKWYIEHDRQGNTIRTMANWIAKGDAALVWFAHNNPDLV